MSSTQAAAIFRKLIRVGTKTRELTCLALVAVVATLICLPTFIYGAPYGHDTVYHMVYLSDFTAQLRDGDWYPRWLTHLNGGAGSPAFFFYAPVPFYIGALFDSVFCASCSACDTCLPSTVKVSRNAPPLSGAFADSIMTD